MARQLRAICAALAIACHAGISPSVVAQEPSATTEPELLLVSTVDLPSLEQEESDSPGEGGEGEPEKESSVLLFPAPSPTAQPQISLDNSFIATRGLTFLLEEKGENQWDLSNSEDRLAGASAAAPSIANLKWIQGEGLVFEWAEIEQAKPHVLSGLKSCLILLDFEGTKEAVLLKECAQWSPMPLDMTRSPMRVDLPLGRLPATAQLLLVLHQIESQAPAFEPFEVGDSEETNMTRIGAKRQDDAATELDIRIVDKQGRHVLETRYYYTDPGGARRGLEAKSLRSSLARRQKQSERASRTVAAAKSALPGLRTLASDSQAAMKTAEGDAYQKAVSDYRAATGGIKKAEGAIKRFTEAIPKMEQGIAHMKKVASVAGTLHRKTKVHLSVYCLTDKYRVPLLVVGDPYESHRKASRASAAVY